MASCPPSTLFPHVGQCLQANGLPPGGKSLRQPQPEKKITAWMKKLRNSKKQSSSIVLSQVLRATGPQQ